MYVCVCVCVCVIGCRDPSQRTRTTAARGECSTHHICWYWLDSLETAMPHLSTPSPPGMRRDLCACVCMCVCVCSNKCIVDMDHHCPVSDTHTHTHTHTNARTEAWAARSSALMCADNSLSLCVCVCARACVCLHHSLYPTVWVVPTCARFFCSWVT